MSVVGIEELRKSRAQRESEPADEPDPPVDPELIASIEVILNDAKNGVLAGFAWAAVYASGAPDSGWHTVNPEQNLPLLASIDLLHEEYRGSVYFTGD